MQPMPFVDLAAQRKRLGNRIDEAMARVLAHGQYIMGPEIDALESKLARYCGTKHAITCASGTDALALVLAAKGIRPGAAVFCPAFTFCATAEVVAWLGATPVFIDCLPDTFSMDPASLEAGITVAKAKGLKPVGVMPVDLFGLPADYTAILPVAEANGLFVLADAAQAFGASLGGKRVGGFGLATATSFYPAKPLGCYGDGGAVMTDDAELASVIRSLRVHGQGSDKYNNVRIGMAARLDTLQAAILLEKLTIFEEEIGARNRIAARYTEALSGVVATPAIPAGATSVWAQYTIKVRAEQRAGVMEDLRSAGIPSMVYYLIPLHQQRAYQRYPSASSHLPVAERLAREVLSLPMHPYLDPQTQDHIIASVTSACTGR